MRLNFTTHNQCVDYLIENFYREGFIDNHTRKELIYILRIIESHTLMQSPYAFRSMCKKRMCKHIDFYLKVHTIKKEKFVRLCDGVTTCCGFDFGIDADKAKYCPVCGRKLIRIE